MRSALSIILLTLYMVVAFRAHITMVNFYLQRDAIADAYCINLDSEITTCRGACYLQSELREALQAPQPEQALSPQPNNFSLLHLFAEVVYAHFTKAVYRHVFFVKSSCPADFRAEIFRPPIPVVSFCS
jgi:hypothetical protein